MPQLVESSQDLTDLPPLGSKTVAEALQRVIAHHPDKVALRTKDDGDRITWAQLGQRVRALAAGLVSLGLGRGDTLALLLPNTVDCHMIDYAALSIGVVPFSIYNSSSAEQIEGLLRRADSEVIVTEHTFLDKARDVAEHLNGQIRHVIVVDGDAPAGTVGLSDIEGADVPGFDFDTAWRAVSPTDHLTLIFTSGTTGTPKAAQWTHHGVMENIRALDASLPVTRKGVVSFLPLAHAGGRITTHYIALAYGSTITACPDMSAAPNYFADAKPDTLLSVPRVFEKLQVGIEALIEAVPDEETRTRVKQTVEIGMTLARAGDTALAESLTETRMAELKDTHRAGLADVRPLLARLGLDHLTSAIVGGAPAAPELCQFFRAIGIPFIEAYGSSEASLCIFNRAEEYQTGSVGTPLPGVEVRLAADRELLIRSAFNFAGYRHQPEETAATLDADGWLHTGDVAEIDERGYVTIIDRKKEIMITTSGKNMSPANIESAIRGESSLVAQVVAVGDNRKYVTALIALDPDAAETFTKQAGLSKTDHALLTHHPVVLAEVERVVARGNRRLSRVEQIKKYVVVESIWMLNGDELTPTGKLKRRSIQAKYAAEINQMYGE